tara:strand:- start:16776 stop:17537 length:762 start_codon:yes stop_codon:yes gene_type:complete
MKTIILSGGYGTRLSELTETIPKPMIRIGGHPIIWHIMRSYAYYGHKDFYLALGYKLEIIKEYFLNYRSLKNDFTIDMATGKIEPYLIDNNDWRVTLVDTGKNTMTGGRVKRLKSFIKNETFLLTYGDGVSNVNIDSLINFHKSHGKMITLTAVRPAARFGELDFNENRVINFQEKPQLSEGWINGGFFVVEPEFFDLIKSDDEMLEREPITRAVSEGELMAYKHNGFWHCMDTKRDHELLENLWKNNPPWAV